VSEPVARRARTPERAPGHASLQRLLDAGAQLLGERGYEGFTISELGRRANLSNGSIYHLMPSKEILLEAIHDHELARLEGEAQARSGPAEWAGLDLGATLRKAVGDLVGVFDRNAPMLRVALARAVTDPAVAQRGARQVGRARERFAGALNGVRDQITHPDPDVAIDLCFRTLMATVRQNVAAAPETVASDLSRERQVQELAAMFEAYLTPAAGSR
jgi:AcrR family transcriptional regulator